MLYSALRVTAGIIWAVALTLLVLGASQERPLDYYAWCMFLSFGASVITGWLVVEHIVAREMNRAAACIADAVARALGEHLADRPHGVPTSIY